MPSAPLELAPDEAFAPPVDVPKAVVEAFETGQSPKEVVPAAETGAVKTSAAFSAALEKLGPRGGTIKVAADADFALASTELKAPGRVVVQAEGRDNPAHSAVPAESARRIGQHSTCLVVFSASGEPGISGIDLILETAFAPERAIGVFSRLARG